MKSEDGKQKICATSPALDIFVHGLTVIHPLALKAAGQDMAEVQHKMILVNHHKLIVAFLCSEKDLDCQEKKALKLREKACLNALRGDATHGSGFTTFICI